MNGFLETDRLERAGLRRHEGSFNFRCSGKTAAILLARKSRGVTVRSENPLRFPGPRPGVRKGAGELAIASRPARRTAIVTNRAKRRLRPVNVKKNPRSKAARIDKILPNLFRARQSATAKVLGSETDEDLHVQAYRLRRCCCDCVRRRLRQPGRGIRNQRAGVHLCADRPRDLRALWLGRLLRPAARGMLARQTQSRRRSIDQEDLDGIAARQQTRQRTHRADHQSRALGHHGRPLGLSRSTARAIARSTPCTSASCSSSRASRGRRC